MDTTRLADWTVKYFHAGPLEGEGWNRLLAFLDNAEYDEGVYIQLEQFLEARGDPEQADQVFIRREERGQGERLHSFAWVRSWVLDLVTAYGRQPGAGSSVGGRSRSCRHVLWRKENMEEREVKFQGSWPLALQPSFCLDRLTF